MIINRKKLTVETNGRLNDVARIMRRLGFRLCAERGLSLRSERFRGFFSTRDKHGNEWHVIG